MKIIKTSGAPRAYYITHFIKQLNQVKFAEGSEASDDMKGLVNHIARSNFADLLEDAYELLIPVGGTKGIAEKIAKSIKFE